MKFTPGPGIGGHCIPIDPYYLSWKLRTLNYNARFIELAGEINTSMPDYWVRKTQDVLNEAGKAVIRVTSRKTIREPFLNFLVEVNWPKGCLVREYTVLLDPPTTTMRRAPKVSPAATT